MQMNFCRRCGSKLEQASGHVYTCANDHTIYANCSPAVALVLFDSKQRVLTIRRAVSPGKGELDFPGGFCDGTETAEAALAREVREEIGLLPETYSKPELICTGIDFYEHLGEELPVLSLIFSAKLQSDTARITTDDDAEQAEFILLQTLDANAIFFDSLKQATKQLQEVA